MKALIIGGAISGIAVSKLLTSKNYEVYLTDAKEIKEKEELEALGIKVYDKGHPDLLKELDYDLIVKNPGIKYTVPFVKYFVDKGYKLYNEIEIALRYANNYRIGAITGTNGKTTTTTLLGEILKANNPESITAGNIGKALSDYVLESDKPHDVSLEIAAFQLLGTENFHPVVSTIINLTPDHLDYFGKLEDYYKAKCLVYKNNSEDDYFLRNLDDPNVMEYCQNIKGKVIDFSIERDDCDLCLKDGFGVYKQEKLFEIAKFKLPGRHNLQNALIASGMAYLMGVPASTISRVINEFKGVNHRISFVRELNGVSYYNDSKGTNVDATITALKAFDKPIHLLAGGYDKHVSFLDLKPYLKNVTKMYLFGDTKYQLQEIYPDAIILNNMEEAIQLAYENAKDGEVVLLSPACASWDQFDNYEQRGDIFAKIVNKLGN